jgi:putative hydrolase of the HAD superfamily
MHELKKLIFDADDTLWDNNIFYENASNSFFDLCTAAGYERQMVVDTFYDFELKVVREKGYGSVNYEYLLESLFSHFNANSHKLNKNKFELILKNFKSHTINKPLIFPGVIETLSLLKPNYELYILTKGNIKEQQRKIDRSGLKLYFKNCFVVSEKNDNTYHSILIEKNWNPNECCMIGNSPKSDINPALRNGMIAIYIPYPYTWKLDNEELMQNHDNFQKVKDITQIPQLLNSLFES